MISDAPGTPFPGRCFTKASTVPLHFDERPHHAYNDTRLLACAPGFRSGCSNQKHPRSREGSRLRIGGTVMKGYVARTPLEGRRPGILVVHEWWGHNEYAAQAGRMSRSSLHRPRSPSTCSVTADRLPTRPTRRSS